MIKVIFYPFQGLELNGVDSSYSSQEPRTKASGNWLARFFGLSQPTTAVVALLFCCLVLSGCGASYVVNGATESASTGTISPSPNSVDFGTVSIGQSVNTKIDVVNKGTSPVEVSQLTLSGDSFSIDGQGKLPITLAAGGTLSFKVHFNPKSDGTSTGQVTIASNSTTSPTALVKLHGNGKNSGGSAPIVPNALSCSSGSITGAATDACSVTISAAAGSGGQSVAIASNNAAVIVPASLTVPAGATDASFTATVTSVTSARSVTLSASANGASASFALQLNALVPTLSINATSVGFGSVTVNTVSTKSVTLTSSGTAPVTVSAASITGSGFKMSGASFPLTLNPNQTAKLSLQFDPASAGAATGQVTINSNSSTSPSTLISLSGAGVASTPVLSGLSCTSGSMTGSGTDSCTVTLGATSGSGGQSVSLSSNNTAVAVPASVMVSANAASALFAATVSSVSTAQAVTLTASSGGATKSFALQLSAGTPTLSVNTTNVAFGNVTVGQTALASVTLSSTGTAPVTISGVSVAGSLFTASGLTAPVTLNPGQTAKLNLQFNSDHASSFTGMVTISSNSSQGSIAVNMSGTGVAAAGTLSALTCSSGSMTGAGTDACTVTLTAAAATSGLNVILSSSNGTVTLPASITVPANSTSANFNATVSSFTSAQSVTLTAAAGSITKSFGLQLNTSGTSILSVNATSVAFGTVVLNTPATQSVTLTSTGTASVTVNSATVTGTGFSISGASFPMTLNPNQSVTLNLQFDPASAGAATGQLTIMSTSSTKGTVTIGLSGTGGSHEVDLSWDAPSSSSDPVAGYSVYRSSDGGNTYQVVASISASQTTYMDNTVVSGAGYDYVVKAYDSSKVESSPSNMTSVTIP